MWDERYQSDDYFYGTAPNDFLQQQFQHIPLGDVLCLAEGEGRNAVFLAQQGYRVTAVDQSAMGLAKATRLAAAKGVSITCVQADLAEFDLGESRWDGIVSIFGHLPPLLRRQVFGQVERALKPGGVLLLEAYRPEQLGFGTGGPPHEDWLMTTDLLLDELPGLRVRHLEALERDVVEGRGHTGLAAVVQLIALREPGQFRVSANRGAASHRVRYVETGGGTATGECTLCQPMLNPDANREERDK